MLEPESTIYDQHWNPHEYLQQYYSQPTVPDDSRTVIGFLKEQLPRRPRGYDRAIEFGCGPTLWTALAIAPHVRQLHLADYLPRNLDEVRRWLTGEPSAHDWRVYTRYVLEEERRGAPTADEVAARESDLRGKVAGLHAAVNFADFLAFRTAFGSSAPNPPYNPTFDTDGDGQINFTDFLAFRNRFGTLLP